MTIEDQAQEHIHRLDAIKEEPSKYRRIDGVGMFYYKTRESAGINDRNICVVIPFIPEIGFTIEDIFNSSNMIECTQEEFELAYHEVMNKLAQVVS